MGRGRTTSGNGLCRRGRERRKEYRVGLGSIVKGVADAFRHDDGAALANRNVVLRIGLCGPLQASAPFEKNEDQIRVRMRVRVLVPADDYESFQDSRLRSEHHFRELRLIRREESDLLAELTCENIKIADVVADDNE